jgi:hypothetical protein
MINNSTESRRPTTTLPRSTELSTGEIAKKKSDAKLAIIGIVKMGESISAAFVKLTVGAKLLADAMRKLLSINPKPLPPASPTKRAKRRVRAINREIARRPKRSIFAPAAMTPIPHRERPIELRGLGLNIGTEVVLVHQEPQVTGRVIAIDNPYIAVKSIDGNASWHYAKNLKPKPTITGKLCYPDVNLSNLLPKQYVSSYILRGNVRRNFQS